MRPGLQWGVSDGRADHDNPVTAPQHVGVVGGQFRGPQHFDPMPSHSSLTATSVGRQINRPMWSHVMPLSRGTRGSAADWSAIGTGSAMPGGQ